jgi:hypothetical protein
MFRGFRGYNLGFGAKGRVFRVASIGYGISVNRLWYKAHAIFRFKGSGFWAKAFGFRI